MDKIPKRVPEIQVSYSFKVARKDRPHVTKGKDSFEILRRIWDEKTIAYQESFFVLFLTGGQKVLGYRCISTGTTNYTPVDAKHIFGIAVKCNARAIILAHNHPSGQLYPSKEDIDITEKLTKGGKLLDIQVLDHIIINPARDDYYSFAEDGII